MPETKGSRFMNVLGKAQIIRITNFVRIAK